MTTIFGNELLLLVVKATLLLTAGGLAAVLAGRAQASIRHLVWVATLTAVVALPVLMTGLPRWTVPVLPEPAGITAAEVTPAAAGVEVTPPPTATRDRTPASMAAPASPAGSRTESSRPVELPHPLVLLWVAGTLAVLGWIVVGQLGVQRLRRRARPVRDATWLREAHDLTWMLDISRPVALLRGVGTATPMTWGMIWPTVLLPSEAEEWGAERRRMVLLHELAHVRRKDCLTQLIAHFACALFWFHPLVWYAARRLRIERERACDALVVRAGASAPDYADHLLHVARSLRAPRASGMAVAMARPSQLEGRLLAVLDAARSRQDPPPLLRSAVVLGILLLAIPLSVLHPGTVSAGEMETFPEPAAAEPTAEASEEQDVPGPAPSEQASAAPGDDLHWQGTVPAGRTLSVFNTNGAVRVVGAASSTATVTGTRGVLRRNQREVRLASVEHAGGVTVCVLPEGARCTADGVRGGERQNRGARSAALTVRVPEAVVLRAETMNGALEIEGVRSDVHAMTMNGAIDARASGSVRARTMNGAINVSMGRTDWGGELALETMNGAIHVTLPDDASTEVSARTMAGGIESDFPLDIRRRPAASTASGTIGRGGRALKLTTMNGQIRIARRGGPLPGSVSTHDIPLERVDHGMAGFAASMEAFGEAMAEMGEEIAEAVTRSMRSFGEGEGTPTPPPPPLP